MHITSLRGYSDSNTCNASWDWMVTDQLFKSNFHCHNNIDCSDWWISVQDYG